MTPTIWIRIVLAAAIALAALLFIRLHNASGASTDSAGYRLAAAWCRDCHSIEAATAGASRGPPDFTAIANRHSTTALSLKVFFHTSHPSMPNLILQPDETENLVDYILSLKRN